MDNIKNGYFNQFGGSFVPPRLQLALNELSEAYFKLKDDEEFQMELKNLYRDYANRPSLLYYANNMSKDLGLQVYLKREDLNHTGAHKINNVLGQGLLAKYLGKKKLIAETGAGQHGVAVATIAAYLGLECRIFMGARDVKAEGVNYYRMKILGAEVIEVTDGQGTLKDAVDAALNYYVEDVDNSYYLLGSAVGPHPYPIMVRDFQKIIGKEIRFQLGDKKPTSIVACVGGGSNAIGAMYEFIKDDNVELVAVEPAGKGADTNKHGLALGKGKEAIIHGFKTLVLTDDSGNIAKSYSIASGLDYPGVGPELSMLKDINRLKLAEITDDEAVKAFVYLARKEGIIPAMESAHAIAYVIQNKDKYNKDDVIVINLSGRGDKDVENIYRNYLT